MLQGYNSSWCCKLSKTWLMPLKRVLRECPTRVFGKSVFKESLTGGSHSRSPTAGVGQRTDWTCLKSLSICLKSILDGVPGTSVSCKRIPGECPKTSSSRIGVSYKSRERVTGVGNLSSGTRKVGSQGGDWKRPGSMSYRPMMMTCDTVWDQHGSFETAAIHHVMLDANWL